MTRIRPAAAAATTFSLMPPTGSTRPTQGNLAGHGGVFPYGSVGQQRGERREHREP
jgi:hypothetical protein